MRRGTPESGAGVHPLLDEARRLGQSTAALTYEYAKQRKAADERFAVEQAQSTRS
ncbi:MAG TPA: hypothetical protein VGA78_04660 [Gemmatimonadales bacterium]